MSGCDGHSNVVLRGGGSVLRAHRSSLQSEDVSTGAI